MKVLLNCPKCPEQIEFLVEWERAEGGRYPVVFETSTVCDCWLNVQHTSDMEPLIEQATEEALNRGYQGPTE